MVEDISNPFFASIARLIEDRACKNGYKIIYCSTDNDTGKTQDLVNMFRDRHVDGYIIAPPEGIEDDLNSSIKNGMPVVMFDRHLPKVDTDYVEIDNLFSTYNATLHLIEQGYKNIAFVTFASKQTQMQARLQGYAVLIPLTILGISGIGPAVVGHEGSTLVVVFNGLRLLVYQNSRK